MAIKRYTAIADNTITNQYNQGLNTRNTSGNAGKADSLEVFKIYGQVQSNTVEQARVLIKFPVNETDLNSSITTIKQDRTAGVIPSAGNVQFIMKLWNVPLIALQFFLLFTVLSQRVACRAVGRITLCLVSLSQQLGKPEHGRDHAVAVWRRPLEA